MKTSLLLAGFSTGFDMECNAAKYAKRRQTIREASFEELEKKGASLRRQAPFGIGGCGVA
jgi:hypothetical protein